MKKLFLGVLITLCMMSCDNIEVTKHESFSTSENSELVIYNVGHTTTKHTSIYYCRPVIGGRMRENSSVSFMSSANKYKVGDKLTWKIEK